MSRLFLFAALLSMMGVALSASARQSLAREGVRDDPLDVLVVNSFHQDIPWQRSFERGLREGFGKHGRKVQIYMEYLDAGRLPNSAPLDWLESYLQTKYKYVEFDILMTESGPAASFVNNRPLLFPDVKRIYLQPSLFLKGAMDYDPRITVIDAIDDYRAAILEMQRMSEPQEVYVIADASTPARKRRLDSFKKALAGLRPEFRTVYLVDLTMEQLLERVANLPANSAIFYLLIFRDGAGKRYIPYNAIQLISERANAPVFSNWESLLGSGILGGHLISAELLGNIAAKSALGHPLTHKGPIAYGYYYDARQLRRWNIDADRLPPGATVRFYQPNLLERYQWQILATLSALVLLTVLSASMIVLNIRRKRAEEEVTEREREYRNILDQLQDVFYRTDAEGKIVMVSPSVQDVLGYKPDELVGRQLAEFYVHPERRAELLEELKRGKGTVYGFEAALRHKDGGEVLFSTNAHHKLDGEGRVVGVEGLARDVSDRKVLEEQLRQAQKMEAVGQLTGGIAHDFNNLLAVISGNSELLRDKLNGSKNLAAIQRAAMRGAELTQRLLAFSRQQALRPRSIDLHSLVFELTELLRPTLGESVRFAINVKDGTWPVMADPAQLENALLNLAINARDAMPNGGVLEISSENSCLRKETTRLGEPLRAGDYVQVSVRDTGMGMAEDLLLHAFEPFYTTKDVGEGSGLGLSMVYGFIRQSGGDVVIESAPGRGTEVKLYLPRAEGTDASEQEAIGRELRTGNGQFILVLEDETDVREFAVNALESLGYLVVNAADAHQAHIQLEEAGGVDLVLSDIALPGGINGPRFVANARTLYPGIRAVFMTGYAPENIIQEGVPDRGEKILRKPFSLNELADAIYESLKT